MKTFLAYIRTSYRNAFQYRGAAIAGMFTQVFWGLILIMVIDAFYTGQPRSKLPISFQQTVNYIWLGQAFLSLLPWSYDRNIQAMIRDGRVSYDFVRPRQIYWLWFSRTLGWRLAAASMRAVPLLLFASAGMRLIGLESLALTLPASVVSLGSFFLTLSAATILGTAIFMLINISMIYTIQGSGAVALFAAVVTLFSGMVIPLPLFPSWTQSLIALLPFRGLVDAPFRIYSAHISPGGVPGVLLHQIVWICILSRLGIVWLRRGSARLIVQGG